MKSLSSLRDLEDRGGVGFPYRIVVEPLLPDFQIVLKDSEVSVPKGGTAAVESDRPAPGLHRGDQYDHRRSAGGT